MCSALMRGTKPSRRRSAQMWCFCLQSFFIFSQDVSVTRFMCVIIHSQVCFHCTLSHFAFIDFHVSQGTSFFRCFESFFYAQIENAHKTSGWKHAYWHLVHRDVWQTLFWSCYFNFFDISHSSECIWCRSEHHFCSCSDSSTLSMYRADAFRHICCRQVCPRPVLEAVLDHTPRKHPLHQI